MATRAYIIKKEGKTFKASYLHWGGNAAPVLSQNYTEKSKVEALFELGQLSVLAENVTPPNNEYHSFYAPHESTTIAYGRDRKDSNTDAETFTPNYTIERDTWIECVYIAVPFKGAVKWVMFTEREIHSNSLEALYAKAKELVLS